MTHTRLALIYTLRPPKKLSKTGVCIQLRCTFSLSELALLRSRILERTRDVTHAASPSSERDILRHFGGLRNFGWDVARQPLNLFFPDGATHCWLGF